MNEKDRKTEATNLLYDLCADIFEKEAAELSGETEFFTDLGAESIDLLEIGLALSRKLNIRLDEERAFLSSFRLEVSKLLTEDGADHDRIIDLLAPRYPHLSRSRLAQLQATSGIFLPLTLADVSAYLDYALEHADTSKNKLT